MSWKSVLVRLGLASIIASGFGSPVAAADTDQAALNRGQFWFRAAGGCTCHTDFAGGGKPLAGGRPLETPFGTYYSTNITPDVETGIGAWSDAEFVRAMREGIAPDGSHYFPVFPYTSFTRIREADLLDMKAYLFSLEPVRRANRSHDVGAPFSWRFTVGPWKWLHFSEGEFEPDPQRSDEWNRGAYLATALAHCGECHTPRTLSGGLDAELQLAGSEQGPEGELAPNITPDAETGIGSWSIPDVVWFLEMGLKPDGDDTQGLMSEVIEHGYSHLDAADLRAIAAYLASVPPVENLLVVEDPN